MKATLDGSARRLTEDGREVVCRALDLTVRARTTPVHTERGDHGRLILTVPELTIRRGDRIAVTGPNGSGKSTLIRALLALLPDDSSLTVGGSVEWSTPNLPAVVLQDPVSQSIMPLVEEEIAFVLENRCIPTGEMDARIDRVLAVVGLAGFRKRLVRTLSGGELQRLSVASALAAESEVLVLDEPFSQLDDEGTHSLMETLARLIRDDPDRTLILVEHRSGPWMSLMTGTVRVSPDGVVAHPPGPPVASFVEPPRGSVPTVTFPRVERCTVTTPVIRATHLAIGHERGTATTTGISLSLGPGEFAAITGANGSGKTTLLTTLSGLLPPLAGELTVCGRDLHRKRERRRLHRGAVCRLVLQEPSTNFIGSTLAKELETLRCPHDRIERVLRSVALPDDLERSPHTLSIGQMRFFSVTAAICAAPRVLLLDEPTAALDIESATTVLHLLRLVCDAGSTVVVATHDVRLLDHPGLVSREIDLGAPLITAGRSPIRPRHRVST